MLLFSVLGVLGIAKIFALINGVLRVHLKGSRSALSCGRAVDGLVDLHGLGKNQSLKLIKVKKEGKENVLFKLPARPF